MCVDTALGGDSKALQAALEAFDDLGVCGRTPPSVEAAAQNILGQALSASGQDPSTMPEDVKAEQVAKVRDALMKFNSNQFKFDNHAEDGCTRFSCASVYKFTSRMNHR